jgi:hypothetical protein
MEVRRSFGTVFGGDHRVLRCRIISWCPAAEEDFAFSAQAGGCEDGIGIKWGVAEPAKIMALVKGGPATTAVGGQGGRLAPGQKLLAVNGVRLESVKNQAGHCEALEAHDIAALIKLPCTLTFSGTRMSCTCGPCYAILWCRVGEGRVLISRRGAQSARKPQQPNHTSPDRSCSITSTDLMGPLFHIRHEDGDEEVAVSTMHASSAIPTPVCCSLPLFSPHLPTHICVVLFTRPP